MTNKYNNKIYVWRFQATRLAVELTSSYAQSAWGSKEKEFELQS